jgi:hypothetical protein
MLRKPFRTDNIIIVVLLTLRVRPSRHILTRSVRSTFRNRQLLIRQSLGFFDRLHTLPYKLPTARRNRSSTNTLSYELL